MKEVKVYDDREMLEFLHNCEKSVFEALDSPDENGNIPLDDFVVTIQGHELHLCPGADNFEALTTAVKECYDMYVEDDAYIQEVKKMRETPVDHKGCDECTKCADDSKEPVHIKDLLKDLFGDLIDKEEIEDVAGTGGIMVMIGRKK